ncbi:ring finger protein 13, partial [Paraphysoderma sedebokerense]
MALGQTHAQCSICLTQYDSNDYVRLLPCKHLFHSDCVDRWLTKEKGCCPVC